MKPQYFSQKQPNITGNLKLRIPQKEGYDAIKTYFSTINVEREIGIVLPVGCGKSGLITISPFATKANRVLVIAPGIRIKEQLVKDFNPSNPKMFYTKCDVVSGNLPEAAVIDGKKTNITDLELADVVITNIQQIQGDDNKWLLKLPADFFDLIVVDEAHHNVADSWERIRNHFQLAKILNLSATPVRADGQMMEGKVIYSFPIVKAIEEGYVKRLKAKVLNPASLKYVRNDNGIEVEVTIDEIRQLGEDDSKFRRGIVSSAETLNTIIDCSIRELDELRTRTHEKRHKIIASALNYDHCIQITSAYQARGLKAAYIHSQEDASTNKKILKKLENHELDVIVQVRMLGEGFDHPFLSVAAVCSIFTNLAPFAQFIGRIMRVIDQNDSASLNNQGVVIFHAGANIAKRWQDFQIFSEADQEFFDQLLPLEQLDFSHASEIEIHPAASHAHIDILEQEDVLIEELDFYKDNHEVQGALAILKKNGLSVKLIPIQMTKQNQRLASKVELDDTIKNRVGMILSNNKINPSGKELDKISHSKINFVFVKSLIDKKCNDLVGKKNGQRGELSAEEIEVIMNQLNDVVASVEQEICDVKA